MAQYKHHDEEWLLQALGEKSIEEIADECGVTEDTINKWVDKHGIEEVNPMDEQPVEEGEPVENRKVITADSEPVKVEARDNEFPERAERCGVGVCQCCGYERMLAKQHLGPDTVGVCAGCYERMRGLTLNSKRSVLENPRIPHDNNLGDDNGD